MQVKLTANHTSAGPLSETVPANAVSWPQPSEPNATTFAGGENAELQVIAAAPLAATATVVVPLMLPIEHEVPFRSLSEAIFDDPGGPAGP